MTLVAFTFANLAVLGWLAAASAPILIHLWMRQTHRETAWAAVRFLQAALERQARKLRLQHWILLAIRTAILVLVVLAAAKPLLDSGPLASGAPAHRLLVIDASMSMSTITSGGATRLAEAKRLAAELVDTGAAGDTYTLVRWASDPQSLLSTPTGDTAAVRRAIEAIEPSYEAASLPRVLAEAKRLIDAQSDPTRPKPTEVILFTDFGANTWLDLDQETDNPLAQQAYADLTELATVTAVDLSGEASGATACVTRVDLAGALPTLARPVEIRAGATLRGAERPEDRVAELVVDGRTVAEQRVTLRPDRETAIDFLHRFAEAGDLSIAVRLTGGERESLPQDDVRWLALNLNRRVRVLCVEGARGAAAYLADALDPSGERDGPIEPIVVSDADLPTIDLGDFACVFFCNVRELSLGEAERLERYLAKGGGAVFFLGDRVDPQRYNEVLGPRGVDPTLGDRRASPIRYVSRSTGNNSEQTGSLLPVRLGDAVSRPSYRVDPLDYGHPIAAPFRGRERAGLLTTPVSRYFTLALLDEAEVALALDSGEPLIVTGEFGRGRLAVVATAASLGSIDPATGEPWTAMPAWPSFLPIVRELLRHVSSVGGVDDALFVGEPISGSPPVGSTAAEVRVERPDASLATPIATASGDWVYDQADRPGVYRYGVDGKVFRGATAVNTDPAEGDPARADPEGLPESLVVRTPGAGAGASAGTLEQPTPLHRWLLFAALALVLCETCLACWFGRGSV